MTLIILNELRLGGDIGVVGWKESLSPGVRSLLLGSGVRVVVGMFGVGTGASEAASEAGNEKGWFDGRVLLRSRQFPPAEDMLSAIVGTGGLPGSMAPIAVGG